MRTIPVLAAIAAVLVLGGSMSCGSKKKGGSRPPPTVPVVTLTAVTIAGTTDTIASVDGNGVADADGVQDTDWSVTVPMNGSALPAHTGGVYSGTLTITAVDSEQRTDTAVYDIEVDP